MIDIKKFKEIDVYQPDDAINLFNEKDFQDFIEKPENKSYCFYMKEFDSEDDDKVIAHTCIVFDVISRKWFTYDDVLIPQEEYDAIHEDDKEIGDNLFSFDEQKVGKDKIEFLKEYIIEHNISASLIDYFDLKRWAMQKNIKNPLSSGDTTMSVMHIIRVTPELDELIQKNREDKEKKTMAKIEEVAKLVANISEFKSATTASMKKMVIKKYILENGHRDLNNFRSITNIKDLAEIKS